MLIQKKVVFVALIVAVLPCQKIFGGEVKFQNLYHTRSIVACEPITSECGIAVVSYPPVSAVVPVGMPGIIVANQSFPSIKTAREIIKEIQKGSDAESALAIALENDPAKGQRQFGVAALSNKSATGVSVANFTGKKNTPQTCQLTGPTYAVQANLQTSAEVCKAMAAGFESTKGSLAMKLLEALKAGTPISHTNFGADTDFSAAVRVYSNKWPLSEITEINADASVNRSANWENNLEFNLISYLAVVTPGNQEDLIKLTASRIEKLQSVLKKNGYYKAQIQSSWNGDAEKALQDFAVINLFFPRETLTQNGEIFIDGPLASYIINGDLRGVHVPKPK